MKAGSDSDIHIHYGNSRAWAAPHSTHHRYRCSRYDDIVGRRTTTRRRPPRTKWRNVSPGRLFHAQEINKDSALSRRHMMASGRLKRLFSAGGASNREDESIQNEGQEDRDDGQDHHYFQHAQRAFVPPRELLASLANTVADPSIATGSHRAACLHRGALVFSAFLACVRLEQKLNDSDVCNARILFSSVASKAASPLDDNTGESALMTSFKGKAKSKIIAGNDNMSDGEKEESRRMYFARQVAGAAALEALPVYDGAAAERLPPSLKPLRDLLVDLLSA